MKSTNILSNTAILIAVFCLILISGEHWGGFYLLYILLGLPHGAVHSVVASAGMAVLLFSHYKYKKAFTEMGEPLLNIVGAILLCLSLFIFFNRDRHQYNYSTFTQALPIAILGLFAVMAVYFLVINISRLNSMRKHKSV